MINKRRSDLDSFFAMYVFPLAGSPTMTISCLEKMSGFLRAEEKELEEEEPFLLEESPFVGGDEEESI